MDATSTLPAPAPPTLLCTPPGSSQKKVRDALFVASSLLYLSLLCKDCSMWNRSNSKIFLIFYSYIIKDLFVCLLCVFLSIPISSLTLKSTSLFEKQNYPKIKFRFLTWFMACTWIPIGYLVALLSLLIYIPLGSLVVYAS